MLQSCPVCDSVRHGPFIKVGVWEGKDKNYLPIFGLIALNEEDKGCCAFHKDWYKTRTEAEEACSTIKLEDLPAELSRADLEWDLSEENYEDDPYEQDHYPRF